MLTRAGVRDGEGYRFPGGNLEGMERSYLGIPNEHFGRDGVGIENFYEIGILIPILHPMGIIMGKGIL